MISHGQWQGGAVEAEAVVLQYSKLSTRPQLTLPDMAVARRHHLALNDDSRLAPALAEIKIIQYRSHLLETRIAGSVWHLARNTAQHLPKAVSLVRGSSVLALLSSIHTACIGQSNVWTW
jgi:hypothetical protein